MNHAAIRNPRLLIPTMPHLRSIPTLFAALVLLAGCVQPFTAAPADSGTLHFTGFIEVQQIHIAAEIGGRILSISVDEGDAVQAGAELVRLDDSLLQKQLAVADARVQQAQAELAQLQAGARTEEIALAEAQVTQAEVALQAAKEAVDDATLLRDHPQELDIQIAQAQAALAEAKAHAEAARYQAAAADIENQMWEAITRDLWNGVQVNIPGRGITTVDAPPDKVDYANMQWNLAGQAAWTAWQGVAQADSAVSKAQAELNDLLAIKKNPQSAEAQVVAATNARDEAAATLEQARARLAAIQTGPTQTQLDAAAAAVQQAQAERDALAVQLTHTTLTAPVAGRVTARYYQPGEVVAPQQRILTMQSSNQLEITIYVPAKYLARIQVDDILPLVVDSAPNRQFSARVTSINDEPEYTLQQAQNVAERADAVYGVHLQLDEADPLLRPGLPADILFQP